MGNAGALCGRGCAGKGANLKWLKTTDPACVPELLTPKAMYLVAGKVASGAEAAAPLISIC
jgi:hypothetical protein